jgi:hypothetical protein
MRYLLGLLGLVVVVGLMTTPARATTYWVADSGGDPGNNCQAATNQSSPKKTINDGITCLNPGDTLIVRSGIYNETMNSGSIPNGSSNTSRTVVKSEVRRGATVRHSSGSPISLHGKSNITIDGFVLDGQNISGAGGIDLNAQTGLSNITIQGVEVKNIRADSDTSEPPPCPSCYGTTAGIGASYDASNVVLHDLFVHDIGMNCAGHNCCNECYGYGIYLSGRGYTLENSEFYNTTGWIVHGYTGSPNGASDNTVRNNYFHDSGGPVLLCQANNKIYNNILYRFGQMGYGLGTGIQTAGACGGQSSHHNLIANNTIVNVTGNCIDNGYGNTNTVQNNICYQTGDNSPNAGSGGGDLISNNLQGTNPLFVNASPVTAADFQLQSGSPARDAGISTSSVFTTDIGGNQRIQNGVQDEGAWEFGGAPPPPVIDPLVKWSFNEGTGTTVADGSGNSRPLTLSGVPLPTWVSPGRLGAAAMHCPGGLGQAAPAASLPIGGAYSWTLWVRGQAAPSLTTDEVVFYNDDQFGVFWGSNDATVRAALSHHTATGSYVNTQVSGALAGGTWYHLGVTYDGSTVKLFLNGQVQSQASATSLMTASGTLTVCNGGGGGSPFVGDVDEMKIWGRALSDAEIQGEFALGVHAAPRRRGLAAK